MCLGGIKDEEHISQCEVLQSCRKTREETGVDRRWSQDSDHGLLHSENRDAAQRAWQGLFESETWRQDREGPHQAVKGSWLRSCDKEGCLIIEEKGQHNGFTGWRSIFTGGCDPGYETDPAGFKNKWMLPRVRRWNFYDLPGLLSTMSMPFNDT